MRHKRKHRGRLRRKKRPSDPTLCDIGRTAPGEHSDAIHSVTVLNALVGAKPGDWYSIPNETESYLELRKRKREGLKRGASDYCIVARPPELPEIRAVYIELKRVDGKGRESANQEAFGAGVQRHGCLYFVCDGWREVREVVEALGFGGNA